jgi:hypothetical protein
VTDTAAEAFRFFQLGFKTAARAAADSAGISPSPEDAMFNTQYERQAVVVLSALWGLAAVLAIAAFTVSAFAATRASPVGSTSHAESVESVTGPSMLRKPRHAISKHKLD